MKPNCVIDNTLLAKYPPFIGSGNIYPLLRDLKGDFFKEEMVKAIRASINDTLSLVVTFPSNLSSIKQNTSRKEHWAFINDYVDNLVMEIVSKASLFDQYQVSDIYFCGDDCSLLPVSQILRLKATIQEYFTVLPNLSVALDLKPHNITFDEISTLKRAGISQINFLVHHTSHKALSEIHLGDHTFDIRELICSTSTLGFDEVCMHLTYGLPCQSLDDFCQTLHAIKTLDVEQINFKPSLGLPMIFPPVYAHRQHCDRPSNQCREQLIVSTQILSEYGYHMLAPGYFVKPNNPLAKAQSDGRLQLGLTGFCESQHFDLLGLGATAISSIANMYCQNATPIERYRHMLNNFGDAVENGCIISEDQLLRRHIVKRLICHLQIDKDALRNTFDIQFDQYFIRELNELTKFIEDRLILNTPDLFTVSPKARLLIQNICNTFCKNQH